MSVERILGQHLRQFESLRLKAYDDLQPNVDITSPDQIEGTLTIGYGHTGPDVQVGLEIDEAHAERLLARDIAPRLRVVRETVNVPLNDHQTAALVSLVYNIGEGNWRKSTALKRLNAGDYAGAAEALTWFNKSKGIKLAGLVRRRESERAMFMQSATVGMGDAPEESIPEGSVSGGESKPMAQSKTQWLGLTGVLGSITAVWGQLKSDAPELVDWALPYLPYVFMAIFGGVMLNRYLESKRGEH